MHLFTSHLPLVDRDSFTNCPTGTAFYTCVSNGFRGCCSTDPCNLSQCPDRNMSPPLSLSESGESERSTPTTETKPRKTDSGITHTIPNSKIVTVTKHTLIVGSEPATTSPRIFSTPVSGSETTTPTIGHSDTASRATPSEAPTSAASSSQNNDTSPLPMGGIVGISVGGAILLAIIGVIVFTMVRRRKSRSPSPSNPTLGKDESVEEKSFPGMPVSANTTGSRGSRASGDPFAPFGGRSDQSEDVHRPPSGTFEMDGTGIVPIELPAEEPASPVASVANNHTMSRRPTRLEPVTENISTDPRANLNSLNNEGGPPTYVNQWNQYKALGSG